MPIGVALLRIARQVKKDKAGFDYLHGRRQGGGQNGHLTPLEIRTKKQKFIENVKSAV